MAYRIFKKVFNIIFKSLFVLLLILLFAVSVTSVSPIYNFTEGEPFSGEYIYNPYEKLDTCAGWKKANFHTHTKVDKGINECPYYPDVVYDEYMSYGYDILAFSNHQQLTRHPYDSSLQINVYEHGYNLFKFHKLVFGTEKERKFDHLLPIFDSQKQFMIDLLNKDGDFVVFNHPDRTNGINEKTFGKVSGYRLVEGDAGFEEGDKGRGTKLKYFDKALSAGRYVHNIIGDDNHNPKNLPRIARRAAFLNTSGTSYEEIKKTLLCGNFFTMRIPDNFNGDITLKKEFNSNLPLIENIGVNRDTIFIHLSKPAQYIKVTSQNGITADSLSNTDKLYFKMGEEVPYARFTARYEDGTTIYTNAFARSKNGDNPYQEYPHPINWVLTVLFNLALLLIAAASIFAIYRLIKKNPRIH